jgi:hypothetical protein
MTSRLKVEYSPSRRQHGLMGRILPCGQASGGSIFAKMKPLEWDSLASFWSKYSKIRSDEQALSIAEGAIDEVQKRRASLSSPDVFGNYPACGFRAGFRSDMRCYRDIGVRPEPVTGG